MANNIIYGFDDGNIRLEHGKCCSHSCVSNSDLQGILDSTNSKFENVGSSFEQIQHDIEHITKELDEMKKCHHHDHHGGHPFDYDKLISLLKDLKFDLNCEYAKRAQEFDKIVNLVKTLETSVKHLDLLRVSKLEKIVQSLVDENKYQFDFETIMKRLNRLEFAIKDLGSKPQFPQCPPPSHCDSQCFPSKNLNTEGTVPSSGKYDLPKPLIKPMTMEDLNELLK